MVACKSSPLKPVTTVAAFLFLVQYCTYAPAWANQQTLKNYHPLRHYPLQRTQSNVFYRPVGYRVRESEVPSQPQPQPLSPSDIQKYNEYQRQIQQWQIAVVVPQGGAPPPAGGVPVQGGQSPPPAPPGSVWIQVPAGGTYYPSGPGAPPSGGGSYPPPDAVYPPSNPAVIPPPDNAFPPPDNAFPPPDNAFPPPDNVFPPPDNAFPPPDNAFPPPDNSLPPPDNNFPPPSEPVPVPVSEQPYPEPQPPATNEPSNEIPSQGSGSISDSALRPLCKSARGQFPGTSCNKFVNCWDDFVVEQECPAGLYFNPGGFCDYPFNVQCAGGAPTDPSSGPTPGGPIGLPYPGGNQPEGGSYPPPPVQPSPGGDIGATGVCPSPYGTFRSTTNCGQFYTCVAGKPYEFICPAGLNFHEDLKVCDYPYRVECNGVPTNPIPEEPETDPEAPEPGLVKPSPSPQLPAPVETNPPVPTGTDPDPVPVGENPAYWGLRKYFTKPSYTSAVVPSNTLGRYHCMGRNNYVYRLSPTCSSVAVCQNGYPRVINCLQGQSFDMNSRQCLSIYRARC